jgi:ElaA protein
MDKFGSVPICISAQKYLIKFYNSLGFVEMGNDYLEDGIPHIKMLKK